MPNTIFRWTIILLTVGLASCGGRHPTGKGDDRPPADGPSAVPPPPASSLPPVDGNNPGKPPVVVAVPPDLQLLARVERAKVCATARSGHNFSLQTRQEGGGTIADPDFVAIKETLQSACSSCHGAPNANLGGFTFLGAYAGDTLNAHGTVAKYPGIAEVAAQVQDSVASGRMPPKALRSANPAAFDLLSAQLARWIAAQKPERSVVALDLSKTVLGLTEAARFTDLGDCIPATASIGTDVAKDEWFGAAKALPDDLRATDFVSLDAAELGRLGTVAYDVEYPLWTDNTFKSRLIHVPAKAGGRQAVRYDALKQSFDIPDNTRFYKTFFRALRRKDGSVVSRPIETRVIVVRHPPNEPLFGTYIWDDLAAAASLQKTPYRDGTAWKDQVLNPVVDEAKNLTRKYAVPARHRCVECHGGGEDGSFVLGFTPLQINRRHRGEAGSDHDSGDDELAQVARLADYGVLVGVDAGRPLPKLEEALGNHETRRATLQAQGYMLGNCSHCHNPNGYAMKTGGVNLDLSAGKIFNFDTNLSPKGKPYERYVSNKGDLNSSVLYHRAAATKEALGFDNAMPLDTPGGRDCRGVLTLARWVKSFDQTLAADAVDQFMPSDLECTKNDVLNSGEFEWVEQDFTGDSHGAYKPRRGDWADPANGMPQFYRELTLDPGLKRLIDKRVPMGFWLKKATCEFPAYPLPMGLPEAEQRPWMKKADGQPKQPWNELYYSTPGAAYFSATCALCHGPRGIGDGTIGRQLAVWSGGSVTVADFAHGMFGEKGANLKVFDQTVRGVEVNLAPNYLIWMAMEGTKVKMPPQASPYIGTHGAQMLKQIKDRCSRQIPSSPKNSSPNLVDHEIYKEVCLYGNLPVTDPEIQFKADTGLPVNAAAQEQWLNKAALNAGWAIYEYLRQATANDAWQPSPSECDQTDLSKQVPPREPTPTPSTPDQPPPTPTPGQQQPPTTPGQEQQQPPWWCWWCRKW